MLLVEHDQDQAALLIALLGDATDELFSVEHVERLGKGLDRLVRGGIDAIILDLFLPDSRGLDTLAKVHSHSPTVPIVVLIGLQDRQVARQAIREGAQDYLVKGNLLDTDRLSRAIRYAIERMRSENALRKSEERFELLARATNDGVWDWDLLTGQMWWKVGVHSFLGYPPYFVGNDPTWRHDRIHEDDRERIATGIRTVIDGGGHFWLDEYRYLCADGSYAWVFDRGYVIHDEAGKPIRMIGALMDITDRKRAEEALRETNETLRTLVQSSPLGIAVTDANLKLRIWNPAAERILGWKSHEVLGRPLPPVLAPDEGEEPVGGLTKRVVLGEAVTEVELRCKRRDGIPVHLNLSMAPLCDAQGEFSGTMAVVANATERKLAEKQRAELEEQLRQSQKMEAVGRLAGGIAHDFNNLLTAISGYGSLLRNRFDGNDPCRAHVEEILKSANLAASLTRQLLAFSRRQVLQPRVLDLNEVLGGMETLLRRLIGEHLELTTVTDDALGRVLADQSQIEQVIMNLAVNARDAMPKGGKLLLQTRNVNLDETYTHRHGRIRAGPHVLLTVTDTGTGMDEEIQSHLFEPFFTTKEIGKGTGLGLATVYGIVKQSDGDIWVYSEPGHGSTFKIYLPRVEEALEQPSRTSPRAEPRKGSETVLLVEDSEFVRRLLRELLGQCGYKVLEASQGHEALRLSNEYEGRIDLLLTDMVMPRMSGRELAAQLAPQRPTMKVLYMSGYTEEAITRHGVLDPGTAFLEKPFTPETLARKLRQILDPGADRANGKDD